MKWAPHVGVMAVAVVLSVAAPLVGQTQAASGGETKPVEVRLDIVADRLRQTLAFATLAVLSPTLSDQRLHAQRLVNWLEGSGGRHFVPQASPEGELRGLIEDANAVVPWLGTIALDELIREQALFFARNVKAFLDLALESSLSALNERRLDQGMGDMRRTFAYLSAALGSASGPAYLGGVLVLISILPGSGGGASTPAGS